MLSATDLTHMRSTQTGHMPDTCVVQAYTQAFNSYGEDVGTWADGTTYACGLEMHPGSERQVQGYTAIVYDAIIRLPITADIDPYDRIKITHRFGEALATPLVYSIVAPDQIGPSGLRLMLRKVTE